jgi:hypothetical protein
MVSELLSTAMVASSVDPEVNIWGEEPAHGVCVASIPASVQLGDKSPKLGLYLGRLAAGLRMDRRSREKHPKDDHERRKHHCVTLLGIM